MNVHDVILRPIVTEKSTVARELANVVTLAVDARANKHQIKGAVEQLFSVNVTGVRTMRRPASRSSPSRRGRRFSAVSVSGSRIAQNPSAIPAAPHSQKIACHGAKTMIRAPSDGAMIGTRMNTAITWDMARAIS